MTAIVAIQASLLLAIHAAAAVPAAIVLPDAIRGVHYEASVGLPLGSRCPSETFWRIAGGDIPPGIVVDATGLHGNPQRMGEYQFLLEAVSNCATVAVPVKLRVKARPLLVVSTNSIQLDVAAGSAPVERRILVGSDWAELPFTLHSDAGPWLSVEAEATVTPFAGSALSAIPIHLHIRPQELQPGVHRAKLRLSAFAAANAPAIDVTVFVRAAAAEVGP